MKKLIAIILCFSIICSSCGIIQSTKKCFPNELKSNEKVISLVGIDGKEVIFNEDGGVFDISSRYITGINCNQQEVSINYNDILYANVTRADAVKIITLSSLSIPVVVIIIIAIMFRQVDYISGQIF